MTDYPVMLSIAGSDPSGGAGLQADLRTATALGVYGMGVVTALTVQNTVGVRDFMAVDPALTEAQLDAVLDDIRPDAVKTGMLPDAATVEAVARVLDKHHINGLVVDPVCVATSGHALSDTPALEASMRLLMSKAAVVTPNIPEAEAIAGFHIHCHEDLERAGRRIIELTGCRNVLVKGGHFDTEAEMTVDWLVRSGHPTPLAIMHPRINTPNTHGTGCTLSSAIASFMARGLDVERAVGRATDWLADAIASGAKRALGHGHGPVDHLHTIHKILPI